MKKTPKTLDLKDFQGFIDKQVMGIEPTSRAWEARILPMNYTCRLFVIIHRRELLRKGKNTAARPWRLPDAVRAELYCGRSGMILRPERHYNKERTASDPPQASIRREKDLKILKRPREFSTSSWRGEKKRGKLGEFGKN